MKCSSHVKNREKNELLLMINVQKCQHVIFKLNQVTCVCAMILNNVKRTRAHNYLQQMYKMWQVETTFKTLLWLRYVYVRQCMTIEFENISAVSHFYKMFEQDKYHSIMKVVQNCVIWSYNVIFKHDSILLKCNTVEMYRPTPRSFYMYNRKVTLVPKQRYCVL